jgi:hypothetical protein
MSLPDPSFPARTIGEKLIDEDGLHYNLLCFQNAVHDLLSLDIDETSSALLDLLVIDLTRFQASSIDVVYGSITRFCKEAEKLYKIQVSPTSPSRQIKDVLDDVCWCWFGISTRRTQASEYRLIPLTANFFPKGKNHENLIVTLSNLQEYAAYADTSSCREQTRLLIEVQQA